MNKKKLIRNAIKCNHCGDVIESKHTHDFKWCSCETIAIDGGLSYAKRSFKNGLDDFTDLSEWEEVKPKEPAYFTIISRPSYITFECPYCELEVEVPFKDVDFNTEYWGDGAWADCPLCKKMVELGDFEYD